MCFLLCVQVIWFYFEIGFLYPNYLLQEAIFLLLTHKFSCVITHRASWVSIYREYWCNIHVCSSENQRLRVQTELITFTGALAKPQEPEFSILNIKKGSNSCYSQHYIHCLRTERFSII